MSSGETGNEWQLFAEEYPEVAEPVETRMKAVEARLSQMAIETRTNEWQEFAEEYPEVAAPLDTRMKAVEARLGQMAIETRTPAMRSCDALERIADAIQAFAAREGAHQPETPHPAENWCEAIGQQTGKRCLLDARADGLCKQQWRKQERGDHVHRIGQLYIGN